MPQYQSIENKQYLSLFGGGPSHRPLFFTWTIHRIIPIIRAVIKLVRIIKKSIRTGRVTSLRVLMAQLLEDLLRFHLISDRSVWTVLLKRLNLSFNPLIFFLNLMYSFLFTFLLILSSESELIGTIASFLVSAFFLFPPGIFPWWFIQSRFFLCLEFVKIISGKKHSVDGSRPKTFFL